VKAVHDLPDGEFTTAGSVKRLYYTCYELYRVVTRMIGTGSTLLPCTALFPSISVHSEDSTTRRLFRCMVLTQLSSLAKSSNISICISQSFACTTGDDHFCK
jgi:hypothetical protein